MSYQTLERRFYRLAQIEHAQSILGWDQQVMMPAKANDFRGRAMAELSVLSAELLQDPQLADLFHEADQESLDSDQKRNLELMKREWRGTSALPAALIEAKSMACNRCEHAWRSLRQQNNWHDFAPLLQDVVKLSREEAQIRFEVFGTEEQYQNPYDALLDLYDPGSLLAVIDPVFSQLKAELPQILASVIEKQAGQPIISPPPVSIEQQRQLARQVMEALGFDFEAGRLDEAAHPFSGGTRGDSRVTTRYDEHNMIEGLMAIVHETGHARYESGLPESFAFQPIGRSMGMGIHESQSLFFELQLARSKSFAEAIAPRLQQTLGAHAAFETDNLHRLFTEVKPGLIRVNADEVSYPLHVILRYEIERDLILGKLEVGEIPERWNQGMQTLLGVDTQGNYKDGPMQDVHWPAGAFGYFPSYTLGALNAAQIHQTLVKDLPNAPSLIRQFDISPIAAWLSRNIWQQGSRLSTQSLLQSATGSTTSAEAFLDHVKTRYLS